MLTAATRRQAGDTIIEVLFAVSIFSLVAVAAISIMNQGINTAQRALEITQVRQQIDAQAETLRFVHHTYIMSLGSAAASETEWVKNVRTQTVSPETISIFGNNTDARLCDDIPDRAFIMNTHTGKVSDVNPRSISNPELDGSTPPPFSQVTYGENGVLESADGVWVEAAANIGENGVGYTDFHIRACWESPGTGPVITIGTIVRLYEPAV